MKRILIFLLIIIIIVTVTGWYTLYRISVSQDVFTDDLANPQKYVQYLNQPLESFAQEFEHSVLSDDRKRAIINGSGYDIVASASDHGRNISFVMINLKDVRGCKYGTHVEGYARKLLTPFGFDISQASHKEISTLVNAHTYHFNDKKVGVFCGPNGRGVALDIMSQ